MKVRFATPADSAAILRIYTQYIDTPITFECAAPEPDEFMRRVANVSAKYPYLVCEDDGEIIGFAYAHRHREREAYNRNAELSIYMCGGYTSMGYGTRLYTALLELLSLQGIKTVYGAVTVPNNKSEALHRKLGFTRVGLFPRTGFKNGEWCDVAWFQKTIAPYDAKPVPVISVHEISDAQIKSILDRASD